MRNVIDFGLVNELKILLFNFKKSNKTCKYFLKVSEILRHFNDTFNPFSSEKVEVE